MVILALAHVPVGFAATLHDRRQGVLGPVDAGEVGHDLGTTGAVEQFEVNDVNPDRIGAAVARDAGALEDGREDADGEAVRGRAVVDDALIGVFVAGHEDLGEADGSHRCFEIFPDDLAVARHENPLRSEMS